MTTVAWDWGLGTSRAGMSCSRPYLGCMGAQCPYGSQDSLRARCRCFSSSEALATVLAVTTPTLDCSKPLGLALDGTPQPCYRLDLTPLIALCANAVLRTWPFTPHRPSILAILQFVVICHMYLVRKNIPNVCMFEKRTDADLSARTRSLYRSLW